MTSPSLDQPVPLMQGPWLWLSEAETVNFLERLTIVLSHTRQQVAFTKRLPISNLRAMPLSFYPGWLLVEGEAQVTPEKVGTFNVLYGPGLMWAIDGSSEVIHDLNSGRIPVVESKTVAAAGTAANRDEGGPSFLKSPLVDLDLMVTGPDYLRFFCGSVWGDEGPFNLVEGVDAPVLQGVKSPNDTWRESIKPVIMHQAGESLIAETLVIYNAGLFEAKFIISKGGVVSMIDGDPIADVELPKQELLSPFRNLRRGTVRIMSSKDAQ